MNPFRRLPKHLREELRSLFPAGAALWIPKGHREATERRHSDIYRQYLIERSGGLTTGDAMKTTADAQLASFSLVEKIVLERTKKRRGAA